MLYCECTDMNAAPCRFSNVGIEGSVLDSFSREFYPLRGAKSKVVKKPFYSLKLALSKRFQLSFTKFISGLIFFIHAKVLSFAKDTHSDKNAIQHTIVSKIYYCYFSNCMKSQTNTEQLKNLFMNDLKSS